MGEWTRYSSDYLAETIAVIVKAYSLANQPEPEPGPLLLKGRDWAEFLAPLIPEHRLHEMLMEAFNASRTNYLLSASDLRNAWLRSLEEERAQAERIANQQPRPPGPIVNCARCGGFKDAPEVVWSDDGKKLGARPGVCKHRPLQPGEWLYKEEQRLNQRAEELRSQS